MSEKIVSEIASLEQEWERAEVSEKIVLSASYPEEVFWNEKEMPEKSLEEKLWLEQHDSKKNLKIVPERV